MKINGNEYELLKEQPELSESDKQEIESMESHVNFKLKNWLVSR